MVNNLNRCHFDSVSYIPKRKLNKSLVDAEIKHTYFLIAKSWPLNEHLDRSQEAFWYGYKYCDIF